MKTWRPRLSFSLNNSRFGMYLKQHNATTIIAMDSKGTFSNLLKIKSRAPSIRKLFVYNHDEKLKLKKGIFM